MAIHTYIVTSTTDVDGVTTIVGTVDGIAVKIQQLSSSLNSLSTSGGVTAVQTSIATDMLKAAIPPASKIVSNNTFIQ